MWILNAYGELSEATYMPSDGAPLISFKPCAINVIDVDPEATMLSAWMAYCPEARALYEGLMHEVVFESVDTRDNSRGEYLCETCYDAMTDLTIPGSQTATGLDEGRCASCQGLH